jgi:hypothetical protein
MTRSELLKPWKIHLGFGGGFLTVLLLSVAINLTNGEAFGDATRHAFSAIKPMEYLMFMGLWYAAAFGASQDERGSRFTALNLSGNHK